MKITKLFAALVPMLLLFSACSKTETTGVSYPQFAHPAADEPFLRSDISFALSETQRSSVDSIGTVKLYRALPIAVDDAYKGRLFEAFQLQNYSTDAADSHVTNYCAGNRQISLYDNGVFTFDITYDTDRKEFPFDLSDEEVGQKATQFLRSNGLLPDGFTLTDKFGEQGVTFEKDGVEQTVVTTKGAWFQRQIDGIEVMGTSKLLVMLNTEGVCSVSSVYSRLGEATEVKLIGLDEAIQRAKKSESLLAWDADKPAGSKANAVVNDVKLVYYDDPLDKNATHIQPCYYFEGKATDEMNNVSNFSILVPALAKERYTNLR